MAETPGNDDLADLPEAVPARRSSRTLQLVWLIPLVAALVGGWIAIKAILARGPTITISFKTAEGLEAGKTRIKYKDVDIGLVKSIMFAPDMKNVIVTAEMVKQTEPHLVEDTRFWVVRARISGGSVSGLGTLLSGAYIGTDLGKSTKSQREFTGLETPPVFAIDAPGREFSLRSESIGSLDTGSPIYYRRLQVGQVTSYALNDDGRGVTIKVFVNAPYDKFVTENTRFWQASGFDVTVTPGGIKFNMESVVSVLIGGVAFETPYESGDLPPAPGNAAFKLFASRVEALKNPEVDVRQVAMVFNESVRGLAVGAPVDFRGIEVGTVRAIKVDYDAGDKRVNTVVEADVYPSRMAALSVTAPPATAAERQAMTNRLIENGLRAQLRTASLVTGQLYIALDFFPSAAKAKRRPARSVADGQFIEDLPTTPSDLRELQANIASALAKIQSFPFEQVGKDLHQTLQKVQEVQFGQLGSDFKDTLQTATRMMQRIDAELTPDARAAFEQARKALDSADLVLRPNSPVAQDAQQAMREIARAAAAFRALADYLERHPEALISGKKEDKP
jgi:paraquat-inducible protein B